MFDTQADLLSYSHLHADVDQLFRAYLDTALMELAQQNIKDQKKYWHGVIKLRQDKLSYPDSEARRATATKEPSIGDLIDALPSAEQPTEALQYLYWFEVRADFWSRATEEDLTTLSKVLPASNRLELLYSGARELEKRLVKLEQPKRPGEGESTASKGALSVESLPQTAVEGLLAKVVGPAKPGKS